MLAAVLTSMALWRPRASCSGPWVSVAFLEARSKPSRSLTEAVHRFKSFRKSTSERVLITSTAVSQPRDYDIDLGQGASGKNRYHQTNLWNDVGNDGWDAPYEMHLLNHA